MPWRYGIVKFRNKHNPDYRFYGIGELFYEEDPLQPHSCTEDPIEPYADAEDDPSEESVVELERSSAACWAIARLYSSVNIFANVSICAANNLL